MLAEERFSKILNMVNENKSVLVHEIVGELGISESTVRRDLTVLHGRGVLIKVHGGATRIQTDYYTKDASVDERRDLNSEEKRQIAKFASTYIKKDDFVYIDAGTTTGYLIDYLSKTTAVFVTNGIEHAKRISAKGLNVFILGGQLKPVTESVIGAEAQKSLSLYNFTKGFFGTNGAHYKNGFTTPDVNEGMIKMQALSRCKDAFVLCDSSKIHQISSFTFAEFSKATMLTTTIKDEKYKTYSTVTEVRNI